MELQVAGERGGSLGDGLQHFADGGDEIADRFVDRLAPRVGGLLGRLAMQCHGVGDVEGEYLR